MRSITNKRICESCGAIDGGGSDHKLLECAGCLSSYFCNTQCQQQSWQLHKKVCRQRKKSVVKIQSNWRGWYTRRQLVINDGQDRCEVCGALDSKDKQLTICDGCKLSLFCSVRCQEYAWKKKKHKIVCQERQKAVLKIQSAWRAMQLQQNAKQKSILPKIPLEILLSQDGYYKYLGIQPELVKNSDGEIMENIIDLNQVNNNHNLLSIMFEGDPETSKVLHRAKTVLSNEELRRNYDVVGLDLEFEEDSKKSKQDSNEGKRLQSAAARQIESDLLDVVGQFAYAIVLVLLMSFMSRYGILVCDFHCSRA